MRGMEIDKDLLDILNQSDARKSLAGLRRAVSQSRSNIGKLRSGTVFSIESLTDNLEDVARAGLGIEKTLQRLKATNKNDVRIRLLSDLVTVLDSERQALSKRLNKALSDYNEADQSLNQTTSVLTKRKALAPIFNNDPSFGGRRDKPSVFGTTDVNPSLRYTPPSVGFRSQTPQNRTRTKTRQRVVESEKNNLTLPSGFLRQSLNLDREGLRSDREYKEQQIQFQADSQRKIEAKLDRIADLLKKNNSNSGGGGFGLPELPDFGGGKGKQGRGRARGGRLGRFGGGGGISSILKGGLGALIVDQFLNKENTTGAGSAAGGLLGAFGGPLAGALGAYIGNDVEESLNSKGKDAQRKRIEDKLNEQQKQLSDASDIGLSGRFNNIKNLLTGKTGIGDFFSGSSAAAIAAQQAQNNTGTTYSKPSVISKPVTLNPGDELPGVNSEETNIEVKPDATVIINTNRLTMGGSRGLGEGIGNLNSTDTTMNGLGMGSGGIQGGGGSAGGTRGVAGGAVSNNTPSLYPNAIPGVGQTGAQAQEDLRQRSEQSKMPSYNPGSGSAKSIPGNTETVPNSVTGLPITMGGGGPQVVKDPLPTTSYEKSLTSSGAFYPGKDVMGGGATVGGTNEPDYTKLGQAKRGASDYKDFTYQFLKSRGYSNEEAAIVMGQATHESAFSPKALNPNDAPKRAGMTHDIGNGQTYTGNDSIGLQQRNGGRAIGMIKNGEQLFSKKWSDMSNQERMYADLDYTDKELKGTDTTNPDGAGSHKKSGELLKSDMPFNEKAGAFGKKFEGYAGDIQPGRTQAALGFLAEANKGALNSDFTRGGTGNGVTLSPPSLAGGKPLSSLDSAMQGSTPTDPKNLMFARPGANATNVPMGTVPTPNVKELQSSQAATRRLPIQNDLRERLQFAAEKLGVQVEVGSGGQAAIGTGGPRTGSTRHDDGGAADLKLYTTDENGNRRLLDMRRPEDQAKMQAFSTEAVRAGATGIGAGMGYMGPSTMHIGGGSATSWGGAPWISDAHRAGMQGQKEGKTEFEAWKASKIEQQKAQEAAGTAPNATTQNFAPPETKPTVSSEGAPPVPRTLGGMMKQYAKENEIDTAESRKLPSPGELADQANAAKMVVETLKNGSSIPSPLTQAFGPKGQFEQMMERAGKTADNTTVIPPGMSEVQGPYDLNTMNRMSPYANDKNKPTSWQQDLETGKWKPKFDPNVPLDDKGNAFSDYLKQKSQDGKSIPGYSEGNVIPSPGSQDGVQNNLKGVQGALDYNRRNNLPTYGKSDEAFANSVENRTKNRRDEFTPAKPLSLEEMRQIRDRPNAEPINPKDNLLGADYLGDRDYSSKAERGTAEGSARQSVAPAPKAPEDVKAAPISTSNDSGSSEKKSDSAASANPVGGGDQAEMGQIPVKGTDFGLAVLNEKDLA